LTALLLITDDFELTVGIRFMKQALLILSVLGMGIAQTSGAAITISQTNNTITNTSVASNYGSSKNIYSTKSGAYVSNNDEISQAISNLSAQAKQKENQLSSLNSRLYAEKNSSKSIQFLTAIQPPLSLLLALHEWLYLVALDIVPVTYVKHYNQQVMSSLQILQPISTPLVARLIKQVSAKSVMICQPK
jgi:hypothetical protein